MQNSPSPDALAGFRLKVKRRTWRKNECLSIRIKTKKEIVRVFKTPNSTQATGAY